jgi:chromosome segregation ATPase
VVDSTGSGGEILYRLQELERQTDALDENINLMDDKLTELTRKHDRIAQDLRLISATAREARDVSGRLQKRADEEAARKAWATTDAETRNQAFKDKIAAIAVLMAIIGAGVSFTKGYAQSAWEQVIATLRDIK